jgi:hypothetical protein
MCSFWPIFPPLLGQKFSKGKTSKLLKHSWPACELIKKKKLEYENLICNCASYFSKKQHPQPFRTPLLQAAGDIANDQEDIQHRKSRTNKQ